MAFFTSGLFWFIEGILFCLLLIGLKYWTDDRNIPMPPWKWSLIILWLIYCAFTIAFIGTSLGENEPTAALKGGILFGVIAIIAAIALGRFLGFLKFTSHQSK